MGIANQIPVTENQVGKTSKLSTIKTKVLIIERRADTFPLDRAVNKADAKILIPVNKKLIENSLNPSSAMAYTAVPSAVKIVMSCDRNTIEIKYMTTEPMSTNFMQIL